MASVVSQEELRQMCYYCFDTLSAKLTHGKADPPEFRDDK